ncbi:MAG: hypothetical protein ACXU86_03160, partial [Archangium sp.]
MANDQETQHPPTSDESAATAPAHAPKKLEQPATWPGNVPSQAQALEVLRGRLTLVVSLPSARKLQEKLTLPEREALMDEGLADSLCDAVAVRWRLAAAQDLLLSAGGKVDEAALDALLAEVDRALEGLRAATPSTPDMGLAIDRAWETLTQEAVDFSSNVKASTQVEVRPPAYVTPKKPAATGKVTFQAQDSQQESGQGRSKMLMYAALAMVVLAVGAYHVSSMLKNQQRLAAPTYPGAPPYTLVTPNESNGTLIVRSMRVGPATPEQQAWLKLQEVKGMQV